MSGTGKSTVLGALARRGHAVVDTDEPGWLVEDPRSDAEPVWDIERVADLLARPRTRVLFVGGCVMNQGALYDRFGAVVLLSAPVEVLLARVVDRANPYGATVADRLRIRADTAAFAPRLRAGATHEIVTTLPVHEVVTRLEAIGAGARPRHDEPGGSDRR